VQNNLFALIYELVKAPKLLSAAMPAIFSCKFDFLRELQRQSINLISYELPVRQWMTEIEVLTPV
jgi:hypothetical protein